ncbi:alginate O-acetyltransferase AlgX-related protein [Wenyingzhuangia sp. IMCC45574]
MIALLLPVLATFVGRQDEELISLKEKLIHIKSLSGLKSIIIQGRSYFLSNYRTKKELYSFYKKQVSDPLQETPSIPNVLYGKEGWLFIGDKHNDAFGESKGVIKFTDSELDKIVENIEECKTWCDKEGIQFFITIPPGKHTVYKEYLPYDFPKQISKLDQLISVYPEVIDLRTALKSAKTKENIPLYFKTDTHWNQIGAFHGYLEIMKSIRGSNENIKIPGFVNKIDWACNLGDITRILGDSLEEKIPVVKFNVDSVKLVQKKLSVPDFHRFSYSRYEMRYHYKESINFQKIMFLRDSYATDLKKYFSSSFKDVLFIYNPYFNKELIKNEKPDIFVYEITERFVDRLLTIHSK